MRLPKIGISLACGLLVAECVVVVRGLTDSFAGAGIGLTLLLTLGVYLIAAVALEIPVQWLWPDGGKWAMLARGLPFLILAFLLHGTFGVSWAVPLGTIPLAVIWAVSVNVRWAIPLAVVMALFAFQPALPFGAGGPPPMALADVQSDGPSFVIVLLDTMRWDHASTYGYERETTPNLTALAERGTRFERAYSSSCWSIPAHASLFTGLMPRVHGAHFEHHRLEPSVPTLAGVLATQGYETVGFSSNPYITASTGMANGFHRFEDMWRPHVMRRTLVVNQLLARVLNTTPDKSGGDVVAEFRRWYEERDHSRPFLAFLNIMEAHAPYQDAPTYDAYTDPSLSARQLEAIGNKSHEAQWLGTRVPEELIETTFDLLDGATRSADLYLGQVMELMAGTDDVVIVALSDHGDLVGEHDLYGHMTSLYEPLIRIPMVAAGPGIPAGTVLESPTSIVDVTPTLLSLANIAPLPTDGIDLLEVFAGTIDIGDRRVSAEHFRPLQATRLWVPNRTPQEMLAIRARRGAVVSASSKRILSEDGSDWGFDLNGDPLELRPFSGPSTEIATTVPEPTERLEAEVEFDAQQLEALRSLGYVN